MAQKSVAKYEVASLLWFAASVFTFLSLLTYHSEDPSFLHQTKALPQNACGLVGAHLSALLITCFGYPSILIPALLAFLGVVTFKQEGVSRWLSTLLGMAIAVMALTVFVTIQSKYATWGGERILTGGYFGWYLQEFLVSSFNHTGASIVSLLVFLIAFSLSTPVMLTKAVLHGGAWLGKHGSRATYVSLKFTVRLLVFLCGVMLMKAAENIGQFLKSRAMGVKKASQAELSAESEKHGDKSSDVNEVEDAEIVEETFEAQDEDRDVVVLDVDPQQEMEEPGIDGQRAATSNIPSSTKVVTQVVTSQSQNAKNLEAIKRAEESLAKIAKSKRGSWKLPTVDFLKKPQSHEGKGQKGVSAQDESKIQENSAKLNQKFKDFGIEGTVTTAYPGPVITLYEFKPGPGVKVSRIAAMQDDLSMALSAQSVRILAPLPGKSVVGIEIPSETRETVLLREFLQHQDFYGSRHAIPIVMGKDISGQPVLSDLARMPHLLCAGQTGSGKSVFMNTLICSLLYRFTPDELRMVLVDPKFIEFRAFQDIPHLLLPVVDDAGQASTALKWAVREMERRYRILAKMNAKNLAGFNQKIEEMGVEVVKDLLLGEESESSTPTSVAGSDWIEAFEPDDQGVPKIGKLPYIVVIIDELADLMMVARKEVEISIARIAQKARAAGIHLVIATQRPSTDVITGLIKANLPSRVSFQLASYVDSKTILDRAGAERLLGQGDMLFIPPGTSQLTRLHGAWVDDAEIEKITSYLKSQGKPVYRDEILVEDDPDIDGDDDGDMDDLYDQGVELVKRSGHASASFLQRHLKIGYNRAARMIETMENKGVVGPADGARPREVLLR